MSKDGLHNDIANIVHVHFKEYMRRHKEEMTEQERERIPHLEFSILNAIMAHEHAKDETSATSVPGQMDIYQILGE